MPADLVSTLHNNEKLLEVLTVAMQLVGGMVPGGGIALEAVGVVLTSLANGCDLGASLQSEARQASIGAKIAVVACGVGTVVMPPAAIVTIPLGAVAAALVPVYDALGAGKTPKLTDVLGFAAAAATAGAGLTGLDTSGVQSALGPLAGAAGSIASDPRVQGLVAQIPGAQASTPADVRAGFFARAKEAIRHAARNGLPLAPAVAAVAVPQPGLDDGSRMHVLRFSAIWAAKAKSAAKAGHPPQDVVALALVPSVVATWNSQIKDHPYTDVEVSKLHGAARDAPPPHIHAPTTVPTVGSFLGKVIPLKPGTPAPSSPPAAPTKRAPLSKHAKVGLGIAGAGAAAFLVKVLVFS